MANIDSAPAAERSSNPTPYPQSDFPQSPSAFDSDERISFSKLDNKFILEAESGTEYEWDAALKRWIPVLDEAEMAKQQEIYKVDGVEEEEEVDVKEVNRKKRKMKKGDEGDQQQKKQRVNTAVYVTSIPLDADKEEIKTVFSKCGMIAEEIDSGEPRIKMYEDDKGYFKGDALVVYFRPESVNLAVTMLDDSDFRLGEKGPDGTMKVQIADYSYKKNNTAEQAEKGKPNKRDQKKVIHKTQKMNEKLADWDDEDPQTIQEKASKWDKTVVLKHMFTLQEIEEDPAAVLDIKEDIREECEKLGEVTNVQLFDKEPDGVATVRFKDPDAAEACARMMNGRWFDKRQLVAYVPTGNEKFKKSDSRKAAMDSDEEEEEAKRLERFGEWLEKGGKKA